MYGNRLNGLINEKVQLEKVRVYKSRQAEFVKQKARHGKVVNISYITANI